MIFCFALYPIFIFAFTRVWWSASCTASWTPRCSRPSRCTGRAGSWCGPWGGRAPSLSPHSWWTTSVSSHQPVWQWPRPNLRWCHLRNGGGSVFRIYKYPKRIEIRTFCCKSFWLMRLCFQANNVWAQETPGPGNVYLTESALMVLLWIYSMSPSLLNLTFYDLVRSDV